MQTKNGQGGVRNVYVAKGRFIAMVLAISLALGLVPASSPSNKAFADETVGTVALTVVAGMSWGTPNVVVNKEYSFETGATLKDLLDVAVAAGDIGSYTLNDYDYVATITDSAGTVLEVNPGYWASYEQGQYYDESKGSVSNELLEDGVSYQLAWIMTPAYTAPDWASLATPSSESVIAGGPDGSGEYATLAVVSGTDERSGPTAIVNATFEFAAGATVEDLFIAAQSAGLISAYTKNAHEFLDTVTDAAGNPAEGSGLQGWWMSYYTDSSGTAGSYNNTLSNSTDGILRNGMTYQFAWESDPAYIEPEWSTIDAPNSSGEIVQGKTPQGNDYNAAAVDKDIYTSLFTNISSSYTGTGDPWKAMDLAAIGAVSNVDVDGLIAAAFQAISAPDATNLQRSIIALTAAGVDARVVSDGNRTVNLIETLSQSVISHDDAIGGVMFALLAYRCGPYDIPANAYMSEADMLARLMSSQLSDGGFTYAGTRADADMTAMAITAFAPFAANDAAVASAMQKALTCLKDMQLADGGFPALEYSQSGWMPGTASNASSTAFAVVAMVSAGLDPSTAWATSSGATPLSTLLSFANASRTAVTMYGVDNEIATEQALRALAAYQGFKNTGAAYNIYLQAKLGQAYLPLSGGIENPSADPVGNDQNPPSGLAKTGDTPFASLVAIGTLALCVLVCVAAVSRKPVRRYPDRTERESEG